MLAIEEPRHQEAPQPAQFPAGRRHKHQKKSGGLASALWDKLNG